MITFVSVAKKGHQEQGVRLHHHHYNGFGVVEEKEDKYGVQQRIQSTGRRGFVPPLLLLN